MGGDEGSRLAVLAAEQFALAHPDAQLTLYGDEGEVRAFLKSFPQNLTCTHTSDVVQMDDKPSVVLRHKPKASMALAINAVASGTADSCVSSGNTGAMMAYGMSSLGALAGIDRPAICKAVPTAAGRCWMLDLGANVQCSAEQLVQFAQLGSAMAHALGVQRPRVGILNMGIEAQKGRKVEQDTLTLLRDTRLNLVGFIEGDAIYKGAVDVVVCDGFTGNTLLKACEGVANLLRETLRTITETAELEPAQRTPFDEWYAQYDPERLNGALFLGLNGVLVKSHGSTSARGFYSALEVAKEQSSEAYKKALRSALNH